MIVLDTNVISEVVRPAPSPTVLSWGGRERDHLVTTVISVGELFYGVDLLPPGHRRESLRLLIERNLLDLGHVLPYNDRAARVYAAVRARRRQQGRPITTEDAMIAAICLVNDADLATRNTADFDGLGLHVINPWES